MKNNLTVLKKGQVFDLDITGLINGPEGIGHVDGFAVFVPLTVPGDRVRVKMAEFRKKHGRADVQKILNPSPARQKPFCALFGKCGGCDWQHIRYPVQLEWKKKIVEETLARIGKIQNPGVNAVLPSPDEFHYRNKTQHPFGGRSKELVAGFYSKGTHKIIAINKCPLESGISTKSIRSAINVLNARNIPPYNESTGTGILRHIVVRTSQTEQKALIILVATRRFKGDEETGKQIMKTDESVSGVMINVNPAKTNVILGRETFRLAGREYITEQISGISFRVSSTSFFQTNTLQTANMLEIIGKMSVTTGKEKILDLFCGAGTIGLSLARNVKHVLGIDEEGSAVSDAVFNAAANKQDNAEFIAGRVEEIVLNKPGLLDVDCVILDPPRSGCMPEVLAELGKAKPEKIIYVSCYPASLARDIRILSDFGYRPAEIQPVDMFPQTCHVETIAKIIDNNKIS